MTERNCTKCKDTKPVEEFVKNHGNPTSVCKKCHATYMQNRRDANPHLAEPHRAYMKDWYKKNAQYVKGKELERKYGITLEDFQALLEKQGGRCAICGTADPGGHGGWHVDHDHVTGKVRGLLCHYHNVGLGHFNDDPELLRKAAAYIESNREVSNAA